VRDNLVGRKRFRIKLRLHPRLKEDGLSHREMTANRPFRRKTDSQASATFNTK
jgi:hypothetical protein